MIDNHNLMGFDDGTGNTNICGDWASDGTQVCVPPSLAPSTETSRCVFSRSWPEITNAIKNGQEYLYATGKYGVKYSSLFIVFVSNATLETIHTSTRRDDLLSGITPVSRRGSRQADEEGRV